MMRRSIAILACLCVLAGSWLLLRQKLTTWSEQRDMEKEISNFTEICETERFMEQTEIGEIPMAEKTAADADSLDQMPDFEKLLLDMQAYNRQIYQSGQCSLAEAGSYEQPIFKLSDYGLDTDVIAILSIPAMDTELPFYLGASLENMGKGAAVLGQTSMPVQGENTNCVIAGHRGYHGIPFLREIERLEPGDAVFLTTYWGKIEYLVKNIEIISPDDLEAIRIKEGSQMLTLITCHPYTVNTQRYAIYCSVVQSGEQETKRLSTEQKIESQTNPAAVRCGDEGVFASTQAEERIIGMLYMLEPMLPWLAIPMLVLAGMLLFWPKKGGRGNSHHDKERSKP